eukprot:2233193-Rhodomonas_salina.1
MTLSCYASRRLGLVRGCGLCTCHVRSRQPLQPPAVWPARSCPREMIPKGTCQVPCVSHTGTWALSPCIAHSHSAAPLDAETTRCHVQCVHVCERACEHDDGPRCCQSEGSSVLCVVTWMMCRLECARKKRARASPIAVSALDRGCYQVALLHLSAH